MKFIRPHWVRSTVSARPIRTHPSCLFILVPGRFAWNGVIPEKDARSSLRSAQGLLPTQTCHGVCQRC